MARPRKDRGETTTAVGLEELKPPKKKTVDCAALGVAFSKGIDGPCQGAAPPGLMQRAVDAAKAEADKQCPSGNCQGEGEQLTLTCYTIGKGEKQWHFWMATGGWTGSCS